MQSGRGREVGGGGWQIQRLTVVDRWTNVIRHHGDKTLVRLVAAGHVEAIAFGRWIGCAAGVVSDDPQLFVVLVWLEVETAIRTGDADPVVLLLHRDEVVGWSCFHNNVITLTNTNQNRVAVVGLNRHEVCSDDQEHVLVDGEDERRGCGGIDQAQHILSALFENLFEDVRRVDLFVLAIRVRVVSAVVVAFTVQDDGLHLRRRISKLDREVLECAVVAPITKQERVQGDIKVSRRRAVEGDWASKTICVLKRVMTVVPRSAILRNVELVSIAITGCNGALCDGIDTVMLEGIEHANTVPVNSCPVVFQEIRDGDFDRVTPASFDPWPGILAVEGFAAVGSSDSVGVDVLVGNVEMILLFIELAPHNLVAGEMQDAVVRDRPCGLCRAVNIDHNW